MRYLIPVIVVACIFCPSMLRATAAPDDPPGIDLAELEKHILESRTPLKSGEFEIRVHSNDNDSDATYHTWLSPDGQVRQERTLKGELQVGILAKDYAYYYSGRPEKLSTPNATMLVDRLPVTQARTDALPFMICDPRSLMFAPDPFSLLPKVKPGMLVGAPGRDETSVKPTEWNGLPAQAVSFHDPRTGNRYQYVAVPSRGFNIVAWQLTGSSGSGSSRRKFFYTMSCELNEVAPSLWFPTLVTFNGVRDGTPDEEEVVTVSPKDVNGQIPQSVFSVGWKLPPKRMLFGLFSYPYRTGGRQPAVEMVWDGRQLRNATRQDEDNRREDRQMTLEKLGSSRGVSNRGLALLAAGLVALAVLVLWVMGVVRKRGHLLNLSAAASMLLCVALGLMWGRSFKALDEMFLVYSIDGSEQVGLMEGTVFFQHRDPDEGVRGRPARLSLRSTAVNTLPPRYWPPLEGGRRVWPGAVRLRSVAVGDSWRGLAFPLWQISLISLIAPGLWLAARARQTYRRRRGLCAACGYDLRAITSGACPECGAALPG